MINLGVICPIQTDATSFYRGLGPLSQLRKDFDDLSLVFPQEVNWSSLSLCDALFLQRPFTAAHLKVAELAKANRVPLWVDFDDDLFSVPAWNPCSSTYNKEDIQKNIATICAMADAVTVSTEPLKEKLQPLSKRTLVIPNALPIQLLGTPTKQERDLGPLTEGDGTLVLWRGSQTHRRDLTLAANACVELAQAHPSVTWFFLGDSPWFTDYMPEMQTITAPPVDPIDYFCLLQKIRPDIVIVPLEDCPFNRSKSNIAFLEATWAGAATLAPKFPEWEGWPGITHYTSSQGFKQALDGLLQLPRPNRQDLVKASWEAIEQKRTLGATNAIRAQVIKELVRERSCHPARMLVGGYI